MIISLNNFKNIIFDLGGVVLNIDHSLTVSEFEEMGVKEAGKLFAKPKQKQLFDYIDKGAISPADFRNEIRKCADIDAEDYLIDEAWNAMLLDLPKERLEFLAKIKARYRTFLLSNTNEIHMNAIHKYLQKDFGIPDLKNYFEKVYLSYKVGMRKPDAEIFKLVLEENNLIASETLFIDDSKEHIEGAKKLGLQTYWLDIEKESILDLGIGI